jgi:GNAT superfamily N-acetyltransferase
MPIRPATQADIDSLLRFEHLGRERLARCVADGYVYAILSGGAIVGVLRYSLFWSTVPFLDLIFIEEGERKKGLGTACMRDWEARMKREGYAHAMISTQADETAQFFYEKLGYRRIGSFLPPGQEADELLYEKTL